MKKNIGGNWVFIILSLVIMIISVFILKDPVLADKVDAMSETKLALGTSGTILGVAILILAFAKKYHKN